jgi:hypothetical protein
VPVFLRRRALGRIALALLWAALAAVFVERLRGRSLDDFFITYRYAQNLAGGHGFVFNPGERVFGTTAPGMGLLLAAGHVISGIPLHWLGTLSTAVALLAIAVLLLLEAESHDRGLEAAIGGTLLVANTFLWACHGAEGPVVLGLLLLAARWGRDRPGMAGLTAGYAVWCRPDAAMGVGLLGLFLWREGRRVPWWYGLAAASALALGAAAAFGYFGQLLPNTWAAKHAHAAGLDPGASATGSAFWTAAAPLLRRHLGRAFPAVLLLGLAGQVPLYRKAGRPGRLLALYAGAVAVAYPMLGVSFAAWYAIPVLAALLVGIGFAVGSAARAIGALLREGWLRRLTVVLSAFGLLALVSMSITPRAVAWYRGAKLPLHFEGYRAAGLWIRGDSQPEDAIGYVEIGTLAYFSQRRIEDLMGLVTPRSIPFVEAGDLQGAFLIKPTRYVVVRPGLEGYMGQITTRRWFRRSYEEAARFHPDSADWTVVYRLKPGATLPLPPRHISSVSKSRTQTALVR